MKRGNKRCLNKNYFDVIILLGLTVGLWLKLIYAQLSSKVNMVPIDSEINKQMYLTSLLTITFVILLLYLIGGKYRMTIIYISIGILGVLFFGDTLYGRYYSGPITLSIFNQVNMVDDVFVSALNLLKWKDGVFLLDYVVIIPFAIIIKKLFVIEEGQSLNKKKALIIVSVLIILVSTFVIRYNRLDKAMYAFEHKFIARDNGLLIFHGMDIKDRVIDAITIKKLSEADRNRIEKLNSQNNREANMYSGLAKDHNLYVIQLEAIMDFLIGYKVDDKEVMPFLSSLQENSVYLSNCYVQTANGNTVDAELLFNTSLLPTGCGAVYYEFPNNTFESLPKALGRNGYSSYSYHGYQGSFWNRVVMHKNLGFEKYTSMKDYDNTDRIGLGISDASFFEQTMDYSEAYNTNEPYYDFMITLSSHYPYNGFYEGEFSGDEEADILTRYYNAANYVDKVLEAFIDKLKADNLYDNSVIVIYGDHTGLFDTERDAQLARDGKSYSRFEWTKYMTVPAFIHIPEAFEGGMTIEDPTGQIDILPTLLNLMDVQMDYTMGTDVLDANYNDMVVKRYGDVITSDFIYLSSEGVTYDMESGQDIGNEISHSTIEKAHEYLSVIDIIYATNYFEQGVKND